MVSYSIMYIDNFILISQSYLINPDISMREKESILVSGFLFWNRRNKTK